MKSLPLYIITFILSFTLGILTATAPYQDQCKSVKVILIPLETSNSIEVTIRHYANEYDVDVDTALRIADCESKMGKYKYNLSGSSAKGVYMFIDKTWKHYCDGDVMNDEDNIKCFMKLYNKYPHWWICS